MGYDISTVDVWVGEVEDRPGALAEKLETLLRAGANIEFAIARPSSDVTSHSTLLFVAPLIGPEQTKAAAEVGLVKSGTMHALRVIGPDRQGLLADMARTLADAGVHIDGLWAAALGGRAVQYIRLESYAAARRAAQILTPKLA
jgi:hypothetical protein